MSFKTRFLYLPSLVFATKVSNCSYISGELFFNTPNNKWAYSCNKSEDLAASELI
jgi:hypothetical protein